MNDNDILDAPPIATIPCKCCGVDIPLHGDFALCADCLAQRREWEKSRDAAVDWVQVAAGQLEQEREGANDTT